MDEKKILVVDDDVNIQRSIELTVKRHGYRTAGASGMDEALKLLGPDTDAVVLDLYLGRETGKDVLLRIREADPLVPVIMISGLATVDDALECVRLGAFDYIQKPLYPGRLLVSLENAVRLKTMRRQMIGQILPVYSSESMARVVAMVEKVSQTRSAVLVTGESGTGKDLVAQLIHSLSPRSDKQLVKINCSALPESLIESELFGHRKGSFTGADRDYDGKIKSAEGGTLFLDEIGELPLLSQVKLLRFLENGEIQRIGETQAIKVDARLVAATNRDLPDKVARGSFREDLYYRLNVIHIGIPPLRERKEDIPPLVRYFCVALAAAHGLLPPVFDDEAVEYLSGPSYPGNVRELRNLLERTIILNAPKTLLSRADIVLDDSAPAAAGSSDVFRKLIPLAEAKRVLERTYITVQLNAHGRSLKATAEGLGVLPTNLARRMRTLGMPLPEDSS